MNPALKSIIDRLSIQHGDYSDFRSLISEINKSELPISKDDILELADKDSRLQLHTTPNNLAKLLFEISSYRSHSTGIDLCCGTGNILYFLQSRIEDLTGVEISENVAAVTSYFVPDIKLTTADTFQYPFTRQFDLVVGNLPWGMPITFMGKTMKSEEAFIRKGFELVSKGGDLVFIVTYNLLVRGNFSSFRREFRGRLKLILGLPKGVMRNTNVKIAILHFTSEQSDIVKSGIIQSIDELSNPIRQLKLKETHNTEISDRWDPEFLNNQTQIDKQEVSGLEVKPLKDLAEIVSGKYVKASDLGSKGGFLYLKPIHIQDGKIDASKAQKFVIEDLLKKHINSIVQPGDIILSTIFSDLKFYIYKKGDPPAFISNNLAIIRSANDDYIMSYLQSAHGRQAFGKQAHSIRSGVTIPYIRIGDLEAIQIPILPISELNSLSNSAIERLNQEQLLNYKTLLTELLTQENKTNGDNTGLVHEPEAVYQLINSLALFPFAAFILERLGKIENQIRNVNDKIDQLLPLINNLITDVRNIKTLPREDEEKLFRICQNLDTKLNALIKEEPATIEMYIEGVKRWLDLWESLDMESQKFLPIAEFIYDQLSHIPDADFSPFVVQYCRVLENEILKKLFETYHSEGLRDIDRKELVQADLENSQTNVFAKMVLKDDRRYELGKMSRIMSYLKEHGNTLKGSKLLQHFRTFVTYYFDTRIVENEFLTDLERIRLEFRNRAAHTEVMSVLLAKDCQTLLRKNLNLFLECKK